MSELTYTTSRSTIRYSGTTFLSEERYPQLPKVGLVAAYTRQHRTPHRERVAAYTSSVPHTKWVPADAISVPVPARAET
eukprot:2503617-Rhodomonas_salina.1